jgi:hypothetical protein
MMSIELAGVVYQIEGVLYAGEAACSLRRAGGELLTRHDFEQLRAGDQSVLLTLMRQHIAAVALLAGPSRPASETIPSSSDAIGDIGCLPGASRAD